MMKRAGLFFVIISMHFLSYAQTENNLAQSIAQDINSGKDTLMFGLFDSTFKTQWPLQEVKNAVPQLQNLLGMVKQVQYVTHRDSEYVFRLDGERTKFHMIIARSRKQPQLLSMLLFTPENPYFDIRRRDQVLTDNVKQTALDLFVDSVVRVHLKRSNTPGMSIGIRYNGKTYLYNYGETETGNHRLPEATTTYEIGSLSKTFTALVVAQLIREGKIRLDDPLNRYLPDSVPILQYEGQPILIRHVLSHTSGLPFSTQRPNGRGDNWQDIFASLKTIQLQVKPGTRFGYSNTGFALLGYVCEKVTNKPMAKLYREYIFSPLGLSQTFTGNERSFSDNSGHIADGSVVPYTVLKANVSAGGIRSTVHDLLKYLEAQTGEETTPIYRDIQLTHESLFDSANDRLAMSWFHGKNNEVESYWHSGATNGFTSKAFFVPEKKQAVIVLSNCKNGDAEEVSGEIFKYIEGMQNVKGKM